MKKIGCCHPYVARVCEETQKMGEHGRHRRPGRDRSVPSGSRQGPLTEWSSAAVDGAARGHGTGASRKADGGEHRHAALNRTKVHGVSARPLNGSTLTAQYTADRKAYGGLSDYYPKQSHSLISECRCDQVKTCPKSWLNQREVRC
jgi:hypothetical protein